MSRLVRVALLNPPSPELCLRDYYCGESAKGDYLWPPLDLLVLSGLLRPPVFEVLVVDAVAEELDEEATAMRIARFRPDWTVALVAGFRLDEDMALLARLRERLGFRLLVSGDTPYHATRPFLERFDWVDGALVDFTDATIASVLRGEGDSPAVVRPSRIPSPVPRKTATPLSYPVPRHELFPLGRYRLPILAPRDVPITSILTSWGCPYDCSYCAVASMPTVLRPLDEVWAELDHVRALGIGGFFLRDMTFGPSPRRMLAFASGLVEHGIHLPWLCEAKLETLTEEIVDRMALAGCRTICFGLESTDPTLLAGLSRQSDPDRLRALVLHARARGIRTLAHFVVGLPGRRSTLELAADLGRTLAFPVDYVSWNRYVPREGSALRTELERTGTVPSGRPAGDVSKGSHTTRWLILAANLAFHLAPRRAIHLIRLLGLSGLWTELRTLWRRTFAPS